MKHLSRVNPPASPPSYMTVTLVGGLGDAFYEIFCGHFAKSYDSNLRYFVIDGTNNGLVAELFRGQKNVASAVCTREVICSPHPLTTSVDYDTEPKHVSFELLEPSLKPEGRYAVIHPFSSTSQGPTLKDTYGMIDLPDICNKLNKLGITPVIVGKSCSYDFGDTETIYVYGEKEIHKEWNSYTKEEKANDIPNAVNLVNKCNTGQLLDLVRHSEFVIGSHSSAATLAFAIGKPCLCIVNDYLKNTGEYKITDPDSHCNLYNWNIKPLFRPENRVIFFSEMENFNRVFDDFVGKSSRKKRILKTTYGPREPLPYKTVVLAGGLGDAVYDIFKGSFAKAGDRLFVANNTHHEAALEDLLSACPQVKRVVSLHDHIVSPFPIAEDIGDAIPIDCPLMPGEPSLRPESDYAVIHPMSSNNNHEKNYLWGCKDMASAVSIQTICDYANIVGVKPVLVGKDCKYEYHERLFGKAELYNKEESIEVNGAINVMNKTSARQLLDLIRHAKFVVGSHSVVAMFAWALDVPCMTILPDYFFMYQEGRPPIAWDMYVAPMHRERNGFMYFSHADLLDRFFVHFLLKNGYAAQTKNTRNRLAGVHKLKTKGIKCTDS